MEKNRIRPITSGKSSRMSYSRQKEVLEMPNLIEVQKDSYQWFLDEGLKEVFAKHNVPITVNRAGSMIGYFLNEGPVTNFEEANKSDLKLFSNMYREMAKEGVFLPPSQFEGTFLSTAHTKDDIEKTIQAFDNALSRIV